MFNSIWLLLSTLITLIPVCFGTVEPLAKKETLSPFFRLDSSNVAFVINDEDVVIPDVSNLNLLAVLYNQELKNTVFLVRSLASVGFGISSPKFLTVIFSPSRVTLASLLGRSSKSDKTPVILNSTLFVRSPFSYPNINSSLLISSVDRIETPIPVQFKNWLIVLSPYVIVLIPLTPFETSVPVVPNPTVESTVNNVELCDASSITLVFPGIVNVPCIAVLSS